MTPETIVTTIPTDHRILLAVQRQVAGLVAEKAELQPVIKRVASEIIAGEMSREIKGIIRKRMSEGRFVNVYETEVSNE